MDFDIVELFEYYIPSYRQSNYFVKQEVQQTKLNTENIPSDPR